ncbi:MAG: head-tail connector protein [Gammaproteobacteria bacterium]
MHTIGSIVPITFAERNAAGALINATTVSLTITLPDGTLVTPAVANPPAETGIYTYDYPTTQVGRHIWLAASTGPTAVYGPIVFNVIPSSPGGIIGLDEAKQHLNITNSFNDEELRGFLEAATLVVEDVVGPVVARSFTEIHDSGARLVLNQCPAISLTTLIPVLTGGTSYLPADLDLDPNTAVVRHKSGICFEGPLRVTYTAGRRVVPDNIVQGTKEIVRHMWDTQRGHSGIRPGLGEEDLGFTSSGFAVPRRALELFGPHKRGPMAA